MSKSPPTTPRPNSCSTNIRPLLSSSESATSRNLSHENTPSVPVLRVGESTYPLRPVHPHSLPHHTPETSHRAPRPVRPAESPTDHERARRLLRGSPQMMGAPTDKSNPSSDPQDDMADREIDHRQSMQPVTPAPVPPPKKKRTRTLTTPHQSAVLHALLAQSRFPTTAVREEVGRSIGLSARKVQIWFQNQRQKARRPRSQSETSRKHFPQYGPFPGGPENTAISSFPIASDQGPGSHMGPAPHSASYFSGSRNPKSSGSYSSESYSGSLESPTQLLGPGMPGSELQTELPYRGRHAVLSRPSTALDPSTSGYIHPRHFMRSSSPVHFLSPPPSSRPTTTSRLHERDFSRTLPPLVFNPPSDRPSFSAPGPRGMHASAQRSAYSPPYFTQRSPSPEAPFAHRPPETSSMSHTLSLPYPLQPHPQWNNSTFTSSLRPAQSPFWTRRGSRSANGSATSPGHLSRDPSSLFINPRMGRELRPVEETLPQRLRRYDPVRAAFIYTSPSEPPSSPEVYHCPHRAKDSHEEVRDDRFPAYT